MSNSIRAEYPTPHKSEDQNVASVLITKDSIFFSIGHAYPETRRTRFLSQVRMSKVFEYPGTTTDNMDRHATNEHDLESVIAKIFQYAPYVECICISAFGPFEIIGKRNLLNDERRERYGEFSTLSNYPEWSQKSPYQCAKKAAVSEHARRSKARLKSGISRRPKILVTLDVNIAAVGEHYYVLERQLFKNYYIKHTQSAAYRSASTTVAPSNDNKDKIDEETISLYCDLALRTSAYIKISNSVNVGYTSNGWISRGRGHAQMSAFLPRRSLKEDDVSYQDFYDGSCSRHGDCVEGLVSLPALIDRLSQEGLSVGADVATLSDLVREHPIDQPVWRWSAYYIAQLAQVMTSLIAPVRISLGGAIVTGPDCDFINGWSPFIDMTRERFVSLIWREGTDKGPMKAIPNYDELQHCGDFIRYRHCEFPTLFGGLMTARWDLYGLYPLPVQDLQAREQQDANNNDDR